MRLLLLSPLSSVTWPFAWVWEECALSQICGTMVKTKSLPEGLYAGRKLTEEAF